MSWFVTPSFTCSHCPTGKKKRGSDEVAISELKLAKRAMVVTEYHDLLTAYADCLQNELPKSLHAVTSDDLTAASMDGNNLAVITVYFFSHFFTYAYLWYSV